MTARDVIKFVGGKLTRIADWLFRHFDFSTLKWRWYKRMNDVSMRQVAIAGALAATVSLERDYAAYVEPNVWVRYAL